MNLKSSLRRREFLRLSGIAGVSAFAFPAIVPVRIFGADAPSKKIQIGQIGCGRIANEMDLPGILKHDLARVVAVCDVDSRRLGLAKERIEKFYSNKDGAGNAHTVKSYSDYKELLKDPEIDAVAISTPDHWHAEPVVAAALAGKDIYVQKPLAMTLTEGRVVSDIVRSKGRIFQIGSQQRADRPWPQFRRGVELVRNGKIGRLHTVKIGLPTDPAGEEEPEMPVPANLNYEMWLGCTSMAPYTEKRVHPQKSLNDRPGWLRIESYCLGMITGWGSHHLDIAHWGMDTELTGPIQVEGKGEFPKGGLWNVHGAYHVEMKYANGVTMVIDNNFPNGVRFEGDEGWIFVGRGGGKPDPAKPEESLGFAAGKPEILKEEIGPGGIHLHQSEDHHLDWLKSIQSRKPAATNVEQAHRSTSACEIAWIAMKLGRKTTWDPQQEIFPGDAEANALRARPQRKPYGVEALLKKA